MNENDNNGNMRRHGRGMFLGVWAVLIGLIFLLNNRGVLQGKVWGNIWPLFLIVPGIFMIFRSKSR